VVHRSRDALIHDNATKLLACLSSQSERLLEKYDEISGRAHTRRTLIAMSCLLESTDQKIISVPEDVYCCRYSAHVIEVVYSVEHAFHDIGHQL